MDMSVVGISEETKTLLEEIEFVAALLPRNKLPRNEIMSWERRKMKEEKKHWYEELFFREAESDVGGLLIINLSWKPQVTISFTTFSHLETFATLKIVQKLQAIGIAY